MLLFILAPLAFAEPQGADPALVNKVFVLTEESDLLEEPEGESLGSLPVGTQVTAVGEVRANFLQVEVATSEGVISGWLERAKLTQNSEPIKKRAAKKLFVPSDERLLLKREHTFFYGLQLGGTLGISQAQSNNYYYVGPGLLLGADLGTYIDRNFPIRFEVNYFQINGSTSLDVANLNFGFLELAVVPVYLISPWELFGGFSYAFGLSAGDLPTGVRLASPSDMSSFWVHGGASYRFSVTDASTWMLRLRYGIAITSTPFVLQTIGLSLAFQIDG